MIINPIIPIQYMAIVCVVLLILKRKGVFNYIRQILMVILLFLMNLRIMVGAPDAMTVDAKTDVYFVIDNTISMLAEDYDGGARRIDAVRADCEYIMDQMGGSRFSVVSFANNAQQLVPLTSDRATIRQALMSLNGQSTMYAKGTNFEIPIPLLKEILDRDSENKTVVFFISDGEITKENAEMPSYKPLSKLVKYGAVLGYGTKTGGKMKASSFVGDDEGSEYVTYYDDNFDKQYGISVINMENLGKVANDLGIPFVHMVSQHDIDSVLKQIENAPIETATVSDSQSLRGYVDIYYFFAIPFVLILGFDLFYYRRRLA